jgi:hypothetical protein
MKILHLVVYHLFVSLFLFLLFVILLVFILVLLFLFLLVLLFFLLLFKLLLDPFDLSLDLLLLLGGYRSLVDNGAAEAFVLEMCRAYKEKILNLDEY